MTTIEQNDDQSNAVPSSTDLSPRASLPPKKKHLADVERKRAPYISAAVARPHILETTIELLRTQPFPSVTVRTIAKAAGLHPSAIMRNFGSMEGLYDTIARELGKRVSGRSHLMDGPSLLADPDGILRTRLIGWLLGQGVDPKEIKIDQDSPGYQAVATRQGDVAITNATRELYAEIMIFLYEGFITFSPVHPFVNPENLTRSMQLLDEMRKFLPEIEKNLGWDETTNAADFTFPMRLGQPPADE
jgi:AcrR family transcriptional regulator